MHQEQRQGNVWFKTQMIWYQYQKFLYQINQDLFRQLNHCEWVRQYHQFEENKPWKRSWIIALMHRVSREIKLRKKQLGLYNIDADSVLSSMNERLLTRILSTSFHDVILPPKVGSIDQAGDFIKQFEWSFHMGRISMIMCFLLSMDERGHLRSFHYLLKMHQPVCHLLSNDLSLKFGHSPIVNLLDSWLIYGLMFRFNDLKKAVSWYYGTHQALSDLDVFSLISSDGYDILSPISWDEYQVLAFSDVGEKNNGDLVLEVYPERHYRRLGFFFRDRQNTPGLLSFSQGSLWSYHGGISYTKIQDNCFGRMSLFQRNVLLQEQVVDESRDDLIGCQII
ncbi:MAG: hypothetical protein ACON5A_01555 [Candidatus Comchoanobacterales bacterium]